MRRSALTLLELVVVLAILATLTLVAVVSTEGVVEQGRFDVTRRTLQNIDDAVLGPANQMEADGTRAISGFAADTGRQPLAFGNDPASQLAELWSNPNSIPLFEVRDALSDAEVKLKSGWRGPYLRAPSQNGVPALLDGWGNPFVMLKADNASPVLNGDEIAYVRCSVAPPQYNLADLTLPVPLITANVSGSLVGSVETIGSAMPTRNVRVRVFVNDVRESAADRHMRVFHWDVKTSEGESGFPSAIAGGHSNKFIPIGTIAVRAYTLNAAGTDIDPNAPKSPIKYLRVPAGGPPTVSIRFAIP